MSRDAAQILQERALQLSQAETEVGSGDITEYATFLFGGHAFAVPMKDTIRANPIRHITEVPRSPPYLVGLSAMEGQLISLLDVVTFYELPRGRVADVSGVVVVTDGKRAIGLAAEELLGVDTSSVAMSPFPAAPTAAGLKGLVTSDDNGRSLLVLDVRAVLQDPRLNRG